jgi:predicted ester cyclase
MSVEDKNKAAVRRLHEVVIKRDWSVLPELFTPDYVYHGGVEYKGPEGVKQMFTDMIKALPDYNETIERMAAEGDLVSVSYTLKGTFTGEYAGISPTGKKLSLPVVVIARFKNGKQVEAWEYSDMLSFYQQLGIPIPQQ